MTYHTISYGVLYYSLRRITLFFTMYYTILYGVLHHSSRRITPFFTMYNTIFYGALYHSSQRIMKSETSPFHNPVSACKASDAGIANTRTAPDPSGVTQQHVNKKNLCTRSHRYDGHPLLWRGLGRLQLTFQPSASLNQGIYKKCRATPPGSIAWFGILHPASLASQADTGLWKGEVSDFIIRYIGN